MRIRNQHVALRLGDHSSVLTGGAKNVYAFKRSAPDNEVIVVINNSDTNEPAILKLSGTWTYRDELTEMEQQGSGELRLGLGPKSGKILVRK